MFGNVPGMPQSFVSRPKHDESSPSDEILKQPPLLRQPPLIIRGPGYQRKAAAAANPYRLLDSGVFNNRLIKIRLQRQKDFSKAPNLGLIQRPGLIGAPPKPLEEGTYEGIKAFVTEAYGRVEHGYVFLPLSMLV